jgi:hypothetical protein
MAGFRKTARGLVRDALADSVTGFNAQLAAIAGAYGVPAFEIVWTQPSDNFAQSYIDDSVMEEVSSVRRYPACFIYCGRAEDERRVKGRVFSGTVFVRVAFVLRYRALTDAQDAGNAISGVQSAEDTESMADAVTDAASEALRAGLRCVYSFSAEPSAVELYGDGYRQRVELTLGIGVL